MKAGRKIFLLLTVIFLLFGASLKAQKVADSVSAKKPVGFKLFFEKVYLHTDRENYTAGEDIWFKAYLVNGQSNLPFNSSNNLYVDLINSQSEITEHKVIRLDDGLGKGDFKLSSSVPSGNYRIRAYTNWMRNFGDNFIFEKPITVFSTSNIETSKQSDNRNKNFSGSNTFTAQISTKKTLIKEALPNIQFFPESGSLVENVAGLVAFKAVDATGNGIAAKGSIYSSAGEKIIDFESSVLGMGSFMLLPVAGNTYEAKGVYNNGKAFTVKLPQPLIKGFSMNIRHTDSLIRVIISTNALTLDELQKKELMLVCKNKGKRCFSTGITLKSQQSTLNIPTISFPSGITEITLYNQDKKPQCERLIYIDGKEKVNFQLTTDKAIYPPKSKVTVSIKATDQNNQPVKANFSLAATDAGVVPENESSIVSYLNFQSELRGKIEKPAQYFDEHNLKRKQQLDLLLLTQGWRDFTWKRIADSAIRLSYAPEQGITITGRVRKVWANKPLPSMNITMFAPKAAKEKLFSTVSDSSGRFSIDGAIIYGYQYLNFTSRDGNGESNRHKNGWIQVDSLFQDRLAVRPVDMNIKKDTLPSKPEPLIEREIDRQKFAFASINRLKEVQIKGYTNALPPEIHPITLAEQKDFGSLEQYLMFMIPRSHETMGGCLSNPAKIHPFLETGYVYPYIHRIHIRGVYADHSKIDYAIICDEDYLNQSLKNVLKVTINAHRTVDGIVYSVVVLLKPGVLGVADSFDNTMADITGYYTSRTFYAPAYDRANDIADFRTTIHWEPNITTNQQGEATVTFYNADPKTKVRIVAEGITDHGIPVIGKTEFVVK